MEGGRERARESQTNRFTFPSPFSLDYVTSTSALTKKRTELHFTSWRCTDSQAGGQSKGQSEEGHRNTSRSPTW